MYMRYSAVVWICLSVLVGCVTEPPVETAPVCVSEPAQYEIGTGSFQISIEPLMDIGWMDMCSDARDATMRLRMQLSSGEWILLDDVSGRDQCITALGTFNPTLLAQYRYALDVNTRDLGEGSGAVFLRLRPRETPDFVITPVVP